MGQFIQNEILGMAWLQRLIGSLLRLCGLDTESRVGGSATPIAKSAAASCFLSMTQSKSCFCSAY